MNDDEQVSSVNWNWFCFLAGTMVMVGVATYLFLPRLISKTETDVIIVKALETPFKVKPTEPNGKIVDHQNLLIVDILKGGTTESDQTETLRPSAPSPEPPPVNVIMDAASKARQQVGKDTITIDAAQKAVGITDTTRLSATKSNNKLSTKDPETTPKTSMKKESAKDKAIKKTVAKGASPTKKSASGMKK